MINNWGSVCVRVCVRVHVRVRVRVRARVRARACVCRVCLFLSVSVYVGGRACDVLCVCLPPSPPLLLGRDLFCGRDYWANRKTKNAEF